MPCDRKLRQGQTIQQRAEEIRRAVGGLDKALAMKTIKPVIGPKGEIAFQGWTNGRDDVTDACAYRRIMATGSALARMEIAKAEQMAGRTVNRQIIGGAGASHSHDGGKTWHEGH